MLETPETKMISRRSRGRGRGYQPTADSRQLQARTKGRDQKRRKELLAQAKVLLKAARAGDRDAAEVLLDVLSYLDVTEAERLALALRGRTYPAGSQLSGEDAERNLRRVFEHTALAVSPPRSKPCMPNRRDFVTMIMAAADHRSTRLPQLDVRRATRDLWSLLKTACDSNRTPDIDRAMHEANSILDGHGVESLDVETRRGGRLFAEYVNMGDTYVSTLIYDHHADRFRITSWGDLLESWERRRRRGRRDDW